MFPNPSKDFVNIAYSLDIVSAVEVTLFDMQGRQVQSTISEPRDAGNHSLSLDISGLTRGIYVCRLRLGNRTEVRQISVTG
ncbi:MAG: T9SS type A sorting domain-containing protein [Candidatus Kapabacteria bacterium]|nr:T9SS type A sorting domain-containing protein [Candidatus Kapabacteria bacterium]